MLVLKVKTNCSFECIDYKCLSLVNILLTYRYKCLLSLIQDGDRKVALVPNISYIAQSDGSTAYSVYCCFVLTNIHYI